MKSLRYIFGGRPHTLADCLDLARSQLPDMVALEVKTDELISEMGICHQFIGTYRWAFGDRETCCTEVYGCLRLPAGERGRRSSLTAANGKLRRRLAEMQRRRIEVAGKDRRFGDARIPRREERAGVREGSRSEGVCASS